ncbi:DUF1569 domain-containing protein [Alteromonas sp. a30]|uniref:DUF1569 domain-containing protein n=1 Tax=Alteromonas sp. a30 TaxID=2730917 RepID=UPI00227ED07F|nr:DUF1569 domain-containing protein [Alteromonas sp. a30]MCY7294966.1 DUF1569 domain-containing protein [Alteromonas sp. a30]
MNRRQFLIGTGVASVAVSAVSFGVWFSITPQHEPLTIDFALAKLERLLASKLSKAGEWSLAQMFTHLAQSVEYSMTGYPHHKSALFKGSIGQLAFSAFHTKGKMTHNLAEEIPGAPLLSVSESPSDIYTAAQRFKASLLAFQQFEAPLHEHFAYGPLTKVQYEAAHVMHFNNHLIEVQSV